MAVQLDLPVALPEVDWSNPLTRGLKAALVFDGGYAFDAATGKPAALTAAFGTPRVAAFPGSGELSLYTPNGSAASVFPGEDWSGPCTIIWKCYVESVDSPWGGLLVKLATGTATQLTVQRNSSNNNFYLSRNYSTSLVTGRSLSSLLGVTTTFAISSESAAAASRLAIHVDGSLVQAFNPGEAQTGGAGALLLGCESSSSATYDSSVYWSSFLRFDRELSAGEIAAIGTNPRQLLVQERRVWLPIAAAGGGDVSAALTGASVATAAGTTVASITAALLGSAASVAAGSVSAGSDVTTALTGASAATAVGTLAAATSAALTGVSSTTASGTLAASISAALTGVSSTAAAGTLSAGGDASAAVTGQAASTAQGTVGVTVSGDAALSGASAAASAGTVAPAISTALTGASAAAAAGTLTAANSNVSVTITGQAVSTAQGTVTASASGAATVALTGAAAVVMAGNIFVIAPSVGWTPVDDSVPNMWVPVDDSNAASWA